MPTQNYIVLLVEDNPNDLVFIERAIRKLNLPLALHLVDNGEKAVRYLKGEGMYADRDRYPWPALILTNMKMPRMDGLDLLRWIKQQPNLQQIPVVVMSSSDNPNQNQEFIDLGVHSYFVKPTSPTSFGEILQEILKLLPPLDQA